MTQRKPSAPKVRSLKEGEATNFPKPDAAQAAQGAPPHEQAERPSDAPSDTNREADDRAHGYSQDSGYRSSGGSSGGGAVEERKRTSNGHAHSDEQIGKAVQMRLLGEPAPRASRLLVSVGDGIVTLSGEVDDNPERLRLIEIVRQVESVREVRDDLTVRAGGRPN